MSSSQAINQTVRRRMPYPVAAAWHRASVATSESQRLHLLVACGEILTRTLSAYLLPDYLRGAPADAVEKVIARLDRPSDGTWVELIRELLRHLRERTGLAPFAPEAVAWYFSDRGRPTQAALWLDELVTMRNQVAHGPAMAGEADAKDRAQAYHARLVELLESLRWVGGYRVVRILNLNPNREDNTFTGRFQFFVGDQEFNEPIGGEWSAHLALDALYLVNPRGDGFLDLAPFLEILTDPRTKQEHCFLFKAIPKMLRLIRAHDPSGALVELGVRARNGERPFREWLADRERQRLFHQNTDHGGTFKEAEERPAVAKGEVLGGRYEVIEPLEKGGMASVLKVRDNSFGEVRALKLLHPHFAEEPTVRQRFLREAEMMARAQHPNVIRVRDCGQLPDGRAFLTMDVMGGGSLRDQIVAGGRPPEQVWRWAEQMLFALAYLHGQGIIHRDVKPGNFLLDERGNVLLADFGIALRTDEERRLTRTLERVGSMAYMAPEQARSRDVTPKADIYSLALVLHELLTGNEGETQAGKGIPGPLGELLRRMGDTDPNRRPTADEALEWVRRSRDVTGVQAKVREEKAAISAASPSPVVGPSAPPVSEAEPGVADRETEALPVAPARAASSPRNAPVPRGLEVEVQASPWRFRLRIALALVVGVVLAFALLSRRSTTLQVAVATPTPTSTPTPTPPPPTPTPPPPTPTPGVTPEETVVANPGASPAVAASASPEPTTEASASAIAGTPVASPTAIEVALVAPTADPSPIPDPGVPVALAEVPSSPHSTPVATGPAPSESPTPTIDPPAPPTVEPTPAPSIAPSPVATATATPTPTPNLVPLLQAIKDAVAASDWPRAREGIEKAAHIAPKDPRIAPWRAWSEAARVADQADSAFDPKNKDWKQARNAYYYVVLKGQTITVGGALFTQAKERLALAEGEVALLEKRWSDAAEAFARGEGSDQAKEGKKRAQIGGLSEEGDTFLRDRDLEKARARFDEVLRIGPGDAHAAAQIEAINKRAAEELASRIEGARAEAAVLFDRGEYSAAIKGYQALLKLAAGDHDAEQRIDLATKLDSVSAKVAAGDCIRVRTALAEIGEEPAAKKTIDECYRRKWRRQSLVKNWMVLIPAGTLMMGDNEGPADMTPEHPVEIAAFLIDGHRVTNAQYADYCRESGHKAPAGWTEGKFAPGKEQHAVTRVTWKDADAYCRFFGKRLPTEEEWERAARGPSNSRYPWGDDYDNSKYNSRSQERPVTESENYPSAIAGVYGMVDAAVWDWTSSWYVAYPGFTGDSTGFGSVPQDKVVRGKLRSKDSKTFGAASRSAFAPVADPPNVGFRCAIGAGELARLPE